MTTYHGIEKITCRDCEYETTDAFTMEVINDSLGECPRCASEDLDIIDGQIVRASRPV